MRARWEGGPVSAPLYALCRLLWFKPVLAKLGFDRLRLVIAGGAPLPPETAAFWQILNVNLCEVYGQTEEAGAIISGQRGPFPRPGNVGALADGWEIRLDADNGESCSRATMCSTATGISPKRAPPRGAGLACHRRCGRLG